MSLRILIYDDEPAVEEILKPLLSAELEKTGINDYEILFACSRKEALLYLEKDIDILFQDIELPENENGIKFACLAKQKNPQTRVIFITAYIKYCEEIFIASPSGFLVKPFTAEKVQRAVELTKAKNPEIHFLNITDTKNKIYRIDFNEISYIENKGRKLHVYDADGKESHLFTGIKLSVVEQQMPKYFIRCHHSFCVNLHFVNQVERYHFKVKTNCEIPISQRKFAYARDSFINFMGDMI